MHRPAYRELSRNIWSAGCSCGWLCDHPLRGTKERALGVWREHRAAVDSARLGRLMTQRPVGAEVDV